MSAERHDAIGGERARHVEPGPVGRVRRSCPECGLEIDICRPQRANSSESSRSARSAYARDLRRQVLCEATCAECRAFWNDVIHRAEHGVEPPRARAALGGTPPDQTPSSAMSTATVKERVWRQT